MTLENNKQIEEFFKNMNIFLQEKNTKYGDSALNPLGIFTKHLQNEPQQPVQMLLVRIDDKLNRVKNSVVLRKNDIIDLQGYLALLSIAKEWINLEDLQD